MTREEAIKWIEYHIAISDYEETDDLNVALHTAIEVLSTEPCEDAISRQAVLDAIHLFFTEEVDKIPTRKSEDGEIYDMHKCQPLLEMNKELCKRIKALGRK